MAPSRCGRQHYCLIVGHGKSELWCNRKILERIPWFKKKIGSGKLNPIQAFEMPDYDFHALRTLYSFAETGEIQGLNAPIESSTRTMPDPTTDVEEAIRFVAAYAYAVKFGYEVAENSIVNVFITYYAKGGHTNIDLVPHLSLHKLHSSKLYELVMRAGAYTMQSGVLHDTGSRSHEFRSSYAEKLETGPKQDRRRLWEFLCEQSTSPKLAVLKSDACYYHVHMTTVCVRHDSSNTSTSFPAAPHVPQSSEKFQLQAEMSLTSTVQSNQSMSTDNTCTCPCICTHGRAKSGQPIYEQVDALVEARLPEKATYHLASAVFTASDITQQHDKCLLTFIGATRSFRVVREVGSKVEILREDTALPNIILIETPNSVKFNVVTLHIAGPKSVLYTYDLEFEHHSDLLLFKQVVRQLVGTKEWEEKSGAKLQAAMNRRLRKAKNKS